MKPKNSSAGSLEITIDFHSAEFNCVDELNDLCGNYQDFEPLGDVITADMRHQRERRRNEVVADPGVDHALPLKKDNLKSVEIEVPESARTVAIVSRGRTLIIDTDADRLVACGKRLGNQGLDCTMLVAKNASTGAPNSRFHQLEFLEADAVSVSGAFGGFSATITTGGTKRQLTHRFDDKAAVFDLVLDLQSLPSYEGHPLPMGYYSPGPDPERLREVMGEIPEMRGQFLKPQFTALIKNRCLHGRSTSRECNHCLDICPLGAIQSVDKGLFINHQLCQGCGCCAMVCPADAMQMIQPSGKRLLHQLRSSLEKFPGRGDFPPTLIISDQATAARGTGANTGEQDRLVIFEVEQIGCAGLDMVLTAFAYGAGTVIISCDPQTPLKIRDALELQMQIARAILGGLGMAQDRVRFASALPEDSHSEEPAGQARPEPAGTLSDGFSDQLEKRVLIRLMVQHLYNQSGARDAHLPLPEGSPFGTVHVDASTCTLCRACTAVCPSGALSSGGPMPRLLFRESSCHQCGFCKALCPEGAIRLEPRLLCDPDRIEAQVVLHEAVPFRCIECGAPFASPAMVTRMERKLAGHWMYAGARQLRRLRMCRTCRTRDALISKDAALWEL